MAWEPLDVVFFILGLLIVAYAYGKRVYKFFEDKDIKYVEPPYPFLGSTFSIMSGKQHITDFIRHSYNKYPDERYIGLFEVQKPLIMMRDPELIKQIGIKDFNSFHDHRVILDENMDLFGRSLFSLQGNKWRDMRATLSPAFSGLKMRNMFVHIEECARNFVNHLENEVNINENKRLEIEVRDMFSKYTNDTIASSAFGLNVDSLKDHNNEFSKIGKLTTNLTDGQMWKVAALAILPKRLTKALKISLSRPEATSFFRTLVQGSMKDRESSGLVRHDMIHLLMQAKKGSLVHEGNEKESEMGFATVQESEIGKQSVKKNWADDDFTAQGLIFFIGGFDTTSAVLSFVFYEIVRNPDIQKRLHEEIDDFKKQHGSSFSYNDVANFKYLDMVISETLRMWPPVAAVDRVCSKEFKLPPPSNSTDKSYTIFPNELVWIPVYGLHHDPKHFPNPDRFDPERFSDENKSSITPGTYLPFGIGPRNCIASRYALMVAKIIIIHVLDKFEVVATEKTEIPVTLAISAFSLQTKNGIWTELRLRNK